MIVYTKDVKSKLKSNVALFISMLCVIIDEYFTSQKYQQHLEFLGIYICAINL